jgi:uncharacterized protein YcfJ
MKRLMVFGVLALCSSPVQAQLFSSEALGGAALGGLAGGIIGHNSHGRTAEGVGIGAGAGLLLGALWHDAREDRPPYVTAIPVAPGPVYYSPATVYYPPAPVYYETVRPDYALTGAVLGGVAGGIIGHNQGGKTLEGVGIGAGAGLLLGGLAESQVRRQERIVYAQPAAGPYAATASASVATPAASSPTAGGSVTAVPGTPILNSYPGSSSGTGASSALGSANNLFGR